MHSPRAILFFVLALAAGAVHAWGGEGHRLIGAIADRHLNDAARQEVALLLRDDRLANGERSQRRTLAEVAGWADEIREGGKAKEHARWHFDDMPVCGTGKYARYCRKGNCASAQLARNIDIMRDRSLAPRRRNEALKWVVHLVGDIHQPLHAANRDDRGGNTVSVALEGHHPAPSQPPLNLHAAWDTQLVRRLIAERGGEGNVVSFGVSGVQIGAWQSGTIADWMRESNRIARNVVYGALPVPFTCGGGVEGVLALDAGYYAKAAPVIEEQIRKAGIRLAGVLNTALK